MSKVIVELCAKGNICHDFTQQVTFTAGSLVQEVEKTPAIQKAIQTGSLKEVTRQRLEEWNKDRAAYVLEHTNASVKSAKFLTEAATTAAESLAKEKAIRVSMEKSLQEANKKADEAEVKIDALEKELAKKK